MASAHEIMLVAGLLFALLGFMLEVGRSPCEPRSVTRKIAPIPDEAPVIMAVPLSLVLAM